MRLRFLSLLVLGFFVITQGGASVVAQESVTVVTGDRLFLDLVTGKVTDVTPYVSRFRVFADRMVHKDPGNSSVYMLDTLVSKQIDVGDSEWFMFPGKSEVGNGYLFFMDVTNYRMYTISGDGKTLNVYSIRELLSGGGSK